MDISESLNVRGNSKLASQTQGEGKAGNIQVKTGSLLLTEGSLFNSSTYGQGNAGNILVQVDDSATLNKSSSITSNVEPGANGNGGNIDIKARNLSITNGAQVQTLVRRSFGNIPAGQGNAGKVTINVDDVLKLDGVSEVFTLNGVNQSFPSLITTVLDFGAKGSANDINITAGELSITDGAQLSSSTAGTGNAGNINIKVRNGVTFDGVNTRFDNGFPILANSGVQSDVKFGANGNGGNIDIKARSLSMDNFSLLSTATSGQGNAGNISMQVDDSITLANTSNIRSNVEQGGVGNGGDIDIKARSLTLTKGAEIGAIVFREENGFRGGKGKAGNIVINAKDFVDISGVSSVQLPVSFPTVGFSSGIFASAERGTTATQPQAAGNITITTGNFNIANGAVVDALTSNDGSGGSITINAKNFTATGGGQVLTTSRGKGDAGDIILNISDRITLSGTDPNFNERFERASKFGLPDDIVNNQGSASGLFANTTAGSTGDGGTIFIDPRRMVIRDGAGVAVNSQGSGKGGDIRIQAGTLKLDNKAFISGETASNQGGNIKLSINDLLLLRRNSKISTSAGTAQAGGDGGNITINAPNGFIVAFPKENSDIAANAFEGSGGRVDITAFNLFNIQTLSRDDLVRLLGTEDPIQLDPQRLSSNDITAISQLNPTLNGDVNIQDINQDPTQGLELPEDLGDSSRLITQSCPVGVARATSRFVITGRGGLPPNPSSPLSSDVLIENRTTNTPPQATHLEQSNSTDSVLVEAQGVDIGTGGEIIFTAKPSKLNSYNPLQRNIGCYGQ